MNETLHTHRLSRKGPVNREVSAALTRMDLGKELAKIWQLSMSRLTVRSDAARSEWMLANGEMANRMYVAQTGLAEAVYRREWNDEWSPPCPCSFRARGGEDCSGCRFEHPDERSNGPMSSQRLRMHSLGICTVQNGPSECMLETGWCCMSRARENVSRTRRLASGMETLCECKGEFDP